MGISHPLKQKPRQRSDNNTKPVMKHSGAKLL
jgi:hypothetical protein